MSIFNKFWSIADIKHWNRSYDRDLDIICSQELDSNNKEALEKWTLILNEFGCLKGEGGNYFRTHFKRYIATLDAISTEQPKRILELGGAYPYAFSMMLARRFSDAELFLGFYDETVKEQKITLQNSNTGEVQIFNCQSFNVERDTWPFQDGFFDVVLCMEILEHLMFDPCFMFREAHRVLRFDGEFIVTTPNIASYESLLKLIDLQSPYNFGVYSKHGAYGRHNREFVPTEVQKIGERSGFSTALLTTKNVYPTTYNHKKLDTIFGRSLDRMDMRNQNIFYVGTKKNNQFLPYPETLFDFDADTYNAKILLNEITELVNVNEPIKGSVVLKNYGQYAWRPTGDDITRLGVMILDISRNLINRDFRRIDLTHAVEPGESIELDFELLGYGEAGKYILRFDMVREHVCWFADIRPNYVDIQITIIN